MSTFGTFNTRADDATAVGPQQDYLAALTTFNDRAKAIGEAGGALDLHYRRARHCDSGSEGAQYWSEWGSTLLSRHACTKLLSQLQRTNDPSQRLDSIERALANVSHLITSLDCIPISVEQSKALMKLVEMLTPAATNSLALDQERHGRALTLWNLGVQSRRELQRSLVKKSKIRPDGDDSSWLSRVYKQGKGLSSQFLGCSAESSSKRTMTEEDENIAKALGDLAVAQKAYEAPEA